MQLARIGGNHGRLPKTEVRRERFPHDQEVVKKIIARDGDLGDMELLGRLYIERFEDGRFIPLFAPGETEWMEAVGLPVYVEHCYPRGVKWPTGSQLDKRSYTVPSPDSVPLGTVTRAYADVSPGELWVRVKLDTSGLTPNCEREVRRALHGNLIDMSISYAHSNDQTKLCDGLGVPFHGGILNLVGGRKGRLIEASLTRDGDIPGCTIGLVKASSEDYCSEYAVTMPTSTSTSSDVDCDSSRDCRAPLLQQSTQPSSSSKIDILSSRQEEPRATPLRSDEKTPTRLLTMADQQGSSAQQQDVTMDDATTHGAGVQSNTSVPHHPPSSSAPSQQRTGGTTTSNDANQQQRSRQQDGTMVSSSPSQQQQNPILNVPGFSPTASGAPSVGGGRTAMQTQPQSSPTAVMTAMQQQDQPMPQAPPIATPSPAAASQQYQQNPDAQKAAYEEMHRNYEALVQRMNNTTMAMPFLNEISKLFGGNVQAATQFIQTSSADSLKLLVDSYGRAAASPAASTDAQMRQQGGARTPTQFQQQQKRTPEFDRNALEQQNMNVLMRSMNTGPLGSGGVNDQMDRKRPASGPPGEGEMGMRSSMGSAAAPRYSGGSSAPFSTRTPDFGDVSRSTGPVGNSAPNPTDSRSEIDNMIANILTMKDDPDMKQSFEQSLFSDPNMLQVFINSLQRSKR